MLVAITAESAADHAPEAAERAEPFDHGARLISATDHAIGAFGIAAGHAVLFPLGGFKQFLEGLRVAVLQQVAWPLPTEDVIGRRSPRPAFVLASAHQE